MQNSPTELPLILKHKAVTPSPEQLPAVLTQDKDIVVTAGAGAGKTRTLVGRFVRLLADGYQLRSIVAITFTRKAAREMRNRVREVVRAYQEMDALTDEERRHWQHLYLALDSARIGTIHSLCAELLRSHPAEAGIDPAFDVLEEGEAGVMQKQAVNAGMAFAARDEVLAELFSIFGEQNLQRTLIDLLHQRLDVDAVLNKVAHLYQNGDIETHWRGQLAEQRKQALLQLLGMPAWEKAVAVLFEVSATDPMDLAEIQRQRAVEILSTFIKEHNPLILQELCAIDLRGGRGAAWPGGPQQRDAVKDALRSLRSLWEKAAPAITRSLNELDSILMTAVPKLMQVYQVVLNHYTRLKDQIPAMDFDDLEIKALNLLTSHPEVQARWCQQFQALLVDEFQDTNSRQRDLLDALNGGEHKLFIVGDGKQSIYRFRGADVTVFREKRVEIESTSGQHIVLTESYRAHRELIHLLNACLKPVLGKADQEALPWVEPFEPLAYIREDAVACESPFMEFHLTAGSKADGALDLAADVVVARIKTMVENAHQHLTYDDVAILCRASASFNAYEDALNRAAIPYNTISGRGFYDRPEIRDTLNALRVFADPTDDLALTGLLRSPMCGLSDMVIFRLLEAANHQQATSLWAYINHLGENLVDAQDDDCARIDNACLLISSLHARVGRMTISDLLKEFLDQTDYRAALVQAGSTRGAHNITKLMSDAHDSGLISINGFLEYVQALKDSGGREGEAPLMSEGAVRIMTVHAAKGLEFGIVVIGDAARKAYVRHGVLIDEDFGILPVLSRREEGNTGSLMPAVYEVAKERERNKDEAESDRMLYVAATRAKEKLLVSGTVKVNQSGKISLSGWLDRLAGEDNLNLVDEVITYAPEGDAMHYIPLSVRLDDADDIPVGCYLYEPEYIVIQETQAVRQSMVQAGKPPYPLLAPLKPAPMIADTDTISDERDPPRRVWRVTPLGSSYRVPGWVVGAMVHKALARWVYPADPGFYDWMLSVAQGYGVTGTLALQYAVRHASEILERFQSSELYERICSAEVRLFEVPYSLINAAGEVEYGLVDALYLSENQWHLVEYKTDFVKSLDDINTLLEQKDYVQQMTRYVNAVTKLIGKRPLPNLCFVNAGGTVLSITNRW